MRKYFKIFLRILIPEKIRNFILGWYPQIYINNTYLLRKTELINPLHGIDNKFIIRQLNIFDADKLNAAYGRKESFEKMILPRLNSSSWVALAAINSEKNEIAYVSWVITENTDFINEFGIQLKKNQFFLRHGFCVLEYRHLGLHTRMEQERINYCIRNGANEIFIQIGNKNKKGIQSVIDNGYILYKKNFIILISKGGIYRELFSTLIRPFKRVI